MKTINAFLFVMTTLAVILGSFLTWFLIYMR